jgi:type II secretory pathway pseudopilin PulG
MCLSNNRGLSSRQYGFTLVELMWAMLLTVILLLSVFGALQVGMKASVSTTRAAIFLDQGTAAIRSMGRYLRQAMVIAEAQPYYIRLTIEKGNQDNQYLTIEYYIYNGILYQRIKNVEKRLVENVRNMEKGLPLFTYFDSNGNEITDPTLRKSETRIIKINLFIDDNLNREPAGLALTDQVFLRNFNL